MIQQKHLWILEELKELSAKGLIKKPRARTSKGYAHFPMKWSIEGYFKEYGMKETGNYRKAFMTYKNGDFSGIIMIDYENGESARKNQLNKTLSDPEYVKYRKAMHDKFGNLLLELTSRELTKEKIENASKKELMRLYNEFREIYTKYEFYNGIWFIIGDDLWKIITERLEKNECTNLSEIETISTCPLQSFVNKETIDVLKAAIEISQQEDAMKFIKSGDFTNFRKTHEYFRIIELVKDYHWMPFLHAGPDLFGEEHYLGKIKNLLNSNNNLSEELEKASSFYPNTKTSQSNIFNKYNLDSETKRLIEDFHILSIMQDERKELIARTHIYFINNLMRKIGGFFNLGPEEASDLYPEVIEKCLIHDIIDLERFNKEKNKSIKISITEPEGYPVYLDEDAKPFLDIICPKNSVSELKGKCASMGYAKGKVKVLKDSDDGYKFEQGDILVTTMTTPDFVPYMAKASAIVTDEGGVTCHAAIVSREFGIPCIVGTERATEVLKDGDIIEVNATEGKIKIISQI